MNYADDLKAHLARYKRNVLNVEEDGSWGRNRRPYPHILPKALQDLNFIDSIRERCSTYVADRGIKRHSDFHHLNSSQAFAFNLFFPSLAGGADSQMALLRALGLQGTINDWKFEEIRDRKERTNFDLWLDLGMDGQVFVEVKLTETGFGGTQADDTHRKRLDDIYRQRLAGKVSEGALNGAAFFRHYQLFRNLSYTDPSQRQTLLLVLPRANESARLEAEVFLRDMVAESCRSSVRLVHVEDLMRRLHADDSISPSVRSALQAVGAKYDLPVSAPVGV